MKKAVFSTLAASLLGFNTAHAAQVDIQITNLTHGSWFTPLLVSAHPAGTALFTPGQAASSNLQSMAEGGDISGLAADLDGLSATSVENPAGGLLAPGTTTMTSLNTDGAPDNTQLSLVGMILPSNDGFVGLNAVSIPTTPGTYVYSVNAYDAGTEGNDEILGSGAPGEAGFPAPPPVAEASGTGGTGVSATSEGFVHVHRGVLGDTDEIGGMSDIDSTVHRWLNPVARVVITVSN